MRHILYLLLFCASTLVAQDEKPYFQQRVDYDIAVTLDDAKHALTGRISIKYRNEAPEALTEIKMHLWANAYKQRNTAFAKQKLRNGSGKFYFADEKDLGGYSNLAFNIDGVPAKWRYHAQHPDIAILTLAQPLQNGQEITITTPINLDIPASFSRLGHVGTSYQMTQWYPKPAVYDRDGWHEMPYLDAGEFYSEFGSFKVQITLPDNYVVGATGELTTASEQKWLNERIAWSVKTLADSVDAKDVAFPASSGTMKTIEYSADRVHDFAWFADKRFYVLTDTAVLGNGRRVPCFGMFTNEDAHLWRKGAFYTRRAVEHYSMEVGDYPWQHATAVHSALSAGGGMEYPMITVIGDMSSASSLDEVITHEVGHNWFYGLLASNERDHPWMDEGMNSFYESTYMDKYYGKKGSVEAMLPGFVRKKLGGSLMVQGIRFFQVNNGHLPPDTHSDASSETQYGLMSYMKPAWAMRWLQASMGDKVFRDMMRDYYAQWSFKHPQPIDFERVVLAHNPNAGWFIDQMMTRKTTDYAVKKVAKKEGGLEVTIKNTSDLASPFPLAAMEKGNVVSQRWEPGFTGTKTVFLPCPEADAVFLDADDITFDLRRQNNYKPVRGPRKPALRLLAATTEPKRAVLGALPTVLWNNYDKTQIGVLLHTPIFPGRKFSMMVMPAYGIGSKALTGAGEVSYRVMPKGNLKTGSKVQHIEFALGGRTFNRDYNWIHNQYLKFTKISPSVTLHMPNMRNSVVQDIKLRAIYLDLEALDFDSVGNYVGKVSEKWPIYEASYELWRKSLPNPSTTRVALEQQSYKWSSGRDASYLKATATHNQKLFYKQGKAVTARFFAGYFLQNTQRNKNNAHDDFARGSLSLLPQGFADYRHDGVFLGRTENVGLLARQIEATDGGFKAANGGSFATNFGFSNDFAIAVNLTADLPKPLPFKIPLRPYFDMGYASDVSPLGTGRPFSDKMIFSGGLNLSIRGMVDVYFPLFSSKNLYRQYREVGNTTSMTSPLKWDYLHQISWSVKFSALQPKTLLDRFSK